MPLEDEGVPLTFLTYFTLTWTAMLISTGAGENYISYRFQPSTTLRTIKKYGINFCILLLVKEEAQLVKDLPSCH